METVILKNGAIEAKPLVAEVMISLKDLADTAPIALYELVMVCKDRNHQASGTTGETLKGYGLYPVHESIRNIVLSAVSVDGLEMVLGSPV